MPDKLIEYPKEGEEPKKVEEEPVVDDDPKGEEDPEPTNHGMVVPYLPDLSGIWALEPRASQAMYRVLERFFNSGFDVNAVHPGVTAKADHFEEQNLTERYVSMYNDGVAVVEIKGTLMKEEPPSRWLNASAITYPQLTELLAGLVEDDSVSKIILKFASNGGTVEGAYQCADSIYDYGKQKPIIAFCDDKCNSAAYLLASQCKQIIAGEGASVGSIGTMIVLVDESEKDKMLGYKRYVVSAPPLKGLGADKAVSKELVKEIQTIVDDHYALFKDRVVRGRSMTEGEITAAATGRVFLPEEALDLKLIDKVTNFYKLIDVTAESEGDDDPVIPDEGGFESMAMTPEEQEQFDAAMKQNKDLLSQVGETEESKRKAAEVAAEQDAKEKAEIQAKLDEAEEEKKSLASQVADLSAKQAAQAQVQAEREMTQRKKDCLAWIQEHMEAGAVIPANVPKLKAFLGVILPANKVIETEYQTNDGTTQKFSGQLYEFALEVLGDSASKKVEFSETMSSRGASETVAGSDTKWIEAELEKDGIMLDDDQPLAKSNNEKALPEGDKTGILTDHWNV